MDFGWSESHSRLRKELTDFILREGTPELAEEIERGHAWGPATRQFLRKLGARGWLAASWPKKYGGLDMSHLEELIIGEVGEYYRAIPPIIGVKIAGPTIMRFGNEEQQNTYLLPIARGEVEFALGYTEPPAGSDLAALDIRAVDDGDDFVITGEKIFNTDCHYAEYHWLGARTDPDQPKHRGVSLFIVDMKSPGISMRPLWTLAGFRTNAVHYDHVRVPKKNLVGTRGRGFHQIAVALDFERQFPMGRQMARFDELVKYVKNAAGGALRNDAIVRRQLAELAAELEVCRLQSYQVAWILDQGKVPSSEASSLKIRVSELSQRMAHTRHQILAPFGQLQRQSKGAILDGSIEYHLRWSVIETIYGGTNEIQRNIIAQRGLGLPRA